MNGKLTGGQMSWADAVAGPLAGATCLWQDLDGVHVEPAPAAPPLTSILWGWREGSLARVRLDGAQAFVALLTGETAGEPALRWDFRPGEGDGRVAGIRGPAVESGSVNQQFEQVVVDDPGNGTGPITFVRQARHG